MIEFRKYWYGKECEGRLTDVETLFIADIDVKGLVMEKAPHIYFCSPEHSGVRRNLLVTLTVAAGAVSYYNNL